jgi:hypothetical protein
MLSPFEYVVVLTSIILGMGITQLITGFAAIVLRWNDVKLYWPHLVLIMLIFIIHIQDWWATYALRNNASWNLPMFLFIILYPVTLYILARILFPIRWSPVPVDLRTFFFDNFRKIYLFMLFLPVHSVIENYFFRGYELKDQVVQFMLILTLGTIVILNKRDEWVHKVLAVFFILLCIASMVIGWNEFVIAA